MTPQRDSEVTKPCRTANSENGVAMAGQRPPNFSLHPTANSLGHTARRNSDCVAL